MNKVTYAHNLNQAFIQYQVNINLVEFLKICKELQVIVYFYVIRILNKRKQDSFNSKSKIIHRVSAC